MQGKQEENRVCRLSAPRGDCRVSNRDGDGRVCRARLLCRYKKPSTEVRVQTLQGKQKSRQVGKDLGDSRRCPVKRTCRVGEKVSR